MDTSPLSRHFDIRLEKLTQEIHDGLREVRRHIQELEEVEKNAQSGDSGQSFAELLKNSIEKRNPPPSGS